MGKSALVIAVLLLGCSEKQSSRPSQAACEAYVDHAAELEEAGAADYRPMVAYARTTRDRFLSRCANALTAKEVDCARAANSLEALDACRNRREVRAEIEGGALPPEEAYAAFVEKVCACQDEDCKDRAFTAEHGDLLRWGKDFPELAATENACLERIEAANRR